MGNEVSPGQGGYSSWNSFIPHLLKTLASFNERGPVMPPQIPAILDAVMVTRIYNTCDRLVPNANMVLTYLLGVLHLLNVELYNSRVNPSVVDFISYSLLQVYVLQQSYLHCKASFLDYSSSHRSSCSQC